MRKEVQKKTEEIMKIDGSKGNKYGRQDKNNGNKWKQRMKEKKTKSERPKINEVIFNTHPFLFIYLSIFTMGGGGDKSQLH